MVGRFIGREEAEDDDMPFEEKVAKLTAQFAEQFTHGYKLQEHIRKNLKGRDYDF